MPHALDTLFPLFYTTALWLNPMRERHRPTLRE
jgi:hypothetical protein